MSFDALNNRIMIRGKEIFDEIAGEKPSLFDKRHWMGKVMEWAMGEPRFKETLFRFVDVFPSISSRKSLSEHVHDYFGDNSGTPLFLAAGARMAGLFGSVGDMVMEKTLSANIRQMGRQFIIGETTDEAVAMVKTLRREGFSTVVDVLGEATLSEREAEEYVRTYLELMDSLRAELNEPLAHDSSGDPLLDWGSAPSIHVAVKPTALYPLANPQDFEGSVRAIQGRMRTLLRKAMEVGGFLCIDMESYRYKDITLELYRRLRLEFPDYPHFGVVLQAYLKDTDGDLEDLIAWAKEHSVPLSVRLVKGAYLDYEVILARQTGRRIPVWEHKDETDAAYERQARRILENHELCHFACASHNVRSIAAVLELAKEIGVPESRYEFQLLYGMAEPVRRAILHIARRVRLYCPYGSLIPGMGYLVRRLIENTSNESFLRQSFADHEDRERLLEDPAIRLPRSVVEEDGQGRGKTELPPFRNEPFVDFTRREHREAFPDALRRIRKNGTLRIPLLINGTERFTERESASINPARPDETLALVSQAGRGDLEDAVAAAKSAFPSWRDTPPRKRAEFLLRAAEKARSRIFELAAWQVLEIGKQWDQAHADVGEAIDFLEFYAREMIRLGEPVKTGGLPGEENHVLYEPRGVAAVIAPWNFPLAISAGMSSAALVAGNCVIYKPSSLTPVTGYRLAELFYEAGLPPGVFNFVPGPGSEVGDPLVDHPDVALIAFTGSVEIGLRIVERAAKVHPGQAQVKRVVCEMGGKNAILIDEDADLDEAVPQVVHSAFAFQGQKCSACSRVIVLDGVYERFMERLLGYVAALRMGPAEDPANFLGPVADDQARRKILEYVSLAEREGTILYKSEVPAGEGYYVPLTVVGDIRPEHRIAREEIFGPVLSVMRVNDFSRALEWANSTEYALTGGVFSRSPEHLKRAAREFRVGNLYLNRGVTGALVERQPFGGSALSGTGTKAGGRDYLVHFMDPRVVTENTMRRGFALQEE